MGRVALPEPNTTCSTTKMSLRLHLNTAAFFLAQGLTRRSNCSGEASDKICQL